MAGLLTFEGDTPAERRKQTAELLKAESPFLFEAAMDFFKDNKESDDPVKMKIAWDTIYKTMINKALPNVTKQEIETTTKVPADFHDYLEWKRKQIAMEYTDYKVEDKDES